MILQFLKYQREQIVKDLTKGNIYKNFILFAIPMVLSGLLSQGYSIIDTVIAGRYLGAQGLAAIGATAPLITFLSSVFWGFGNGLGVYMAMLFGAKNYRRIKSELDSHLIAINSVILISCGLVIAFRRPIYTMLRIDSEILADADIYFTIYVFGLASVIMNYYGVYIMNAFGSSSFPFAMSLLSAVLNIGGNLLSVAVLHIGVAGLAISSVVSALIVDLFYLFRLRWCYIKFGLSEMRFKFSLRRLSNAFRYCLPTTFQQMVMYLSTLLISPLVNGIGSAASASYTVSIRIYDINASIYQNSAKTVSTYTAQAVGAGKTDKLRRGLLAGLLQGLMFLLPVLLSCALFPRQICSLFFKNGDSPEAISYAVMFLQVYLPWIVINLIANLFHAYYRGVAAMTPLFIATLIGSIARLVASSLLIGPLGMRGMFLGWVISWVADALFGWIFYLSGAWKKGLPNFRQSQKVSESQTKNTV